MKACPTCGQRFLGDEEFCPKDGATLVELDATPDDPLVGVTIDGRYNVESKIGEGGMGVVYKATHAAIGKKFAIKVLRGDLASEQEVAERFTQEAQSAAAIGNEHIIEITDFGRVPDGSPYFVMEMLEGAELNDSLKDNAKVPLERVLPIMDQCCDALSAAHEAGIVHRDLKPENVFLISRGGNDDFVKILDFGIAKVARETGRLTRTGMIFGTPQYMSPEQAAGADIDARTDIYSLGIIMYELLCGHVPFEADTFMGVLTKHLYEEPIPPNRLVPPVDIPASVEAVLLKSVAKKPEKRYQSMSDFRTDIVDLMEGRTPNIVYDQMRDHALSTLPPPPPSAVLGLGSGSNYGDDAIGLPGTKRWPIFAGIGAVLVVAGIVVTVLLSGGSDGGDAQAETVDTSSVSVEAALVAAPDPAEKEAVRERITIKSDPSGARLFSEGAMLGSLPFEVLRPTADGKMSPYLLKLDGYEDLKVVVTQTTPEVHTVAMIKKGSKENNSRDSESRRSRKSKKRTKNSAEGVEKKETKKEVKSGVVPRKKKRKSIGGDIADPWAS